MAQQEYTSENVTVDNEAPQARQGKQNQNVYEGTAPSATKTADESPEVARATKDGWAPKEQWKGDPSKWVDAAEFNYRGELMRHIQRANDEVAELKASKGVTDKALEKLGKIHQKTLEREKQDILDSIEAEKVQAIEDGDGKAAVAADKKLDKVKAEFQEMEGEIANESPDQEGQIQYPQEYVDWAQNNNQWYGKNAAMTAKSDLEAQVFLVDYYEEHGVQPQPREVLEHLDVYIRETYPKAFGLDEAPQKSTRQQSTEMIEPGAKAPTQKRNSGNKSNYTEKDLTAEEVPVVRQMARVSDMSVQDYINHLAELNELDVQQ